MSADNRSVTTDALHTLGTIIGESEQRDAIHLAVENVIAATSLFPGDHIGFDEDGRVSRRAAKLVGIVDPFLTAAVEPNQRFWLVVYPRQITSLRHVWTHPDFPGTVEVPALTRAQNEINLRALEAGIEGLTDSIEHLHRVAQENGLSYEELMEGASQYVEYGVYLSEGGRFEGCVITPDFWPHYERVTGKIVLERIRGNFFSCSC